MGMQLIETIEVGSGGAASIEFTSIPQDGVDLEIRLSSRVGGTYVDENIFITLNGNTTNDGSIILRGTGTGVGGQSLTYVAAKTSGGGTTSNTFGNASFYISNYTSSNDKSISIDSVLENNASSAWQVITAGQTPVGAVTEIELYGSYDFQQYSTASLYKITAD